MFFFYLKARNMCNNYDAFEAYMWHYGQPIWFNDFATQCLYECPEQTKGIDLHIPRGLMGNI